MGFSLSTPLLSLLRRPCCARPAGWFGDRGGQNIRSGRRRSPSIRSDGSHRCRRRCRRGNIRKTASDPIGIALEFFHAAKRRPSAAVSAVVFTVEVGRLIGHSTAGHGNRSVSARAAVKKSRITLFWKIGRSYWGGSPCMTLRDALSICCRILGASSNAVFFRFIPKTRALKGINHHGILC
jgi:hypothetical protein